jgi:SAM-dependent MidA family methyltransferase
VPPTSNPLVSKLRADLVARGPLPFREFMARALYDPGHGYYAAGRARIGRAGDFFTNVSVGPLFGTLLARQFVEVWDRLGRPGDFTIVEQGAHRGEFARDVLQALARLAPECAATVRYVIVEPSAVLSAAQREHLRDERGEWFASLEEVPPFTGIHFSNELIDAFPVHLVRSDGIAWKERYVAWEHDHFIFVDGPLTDPGLSARLEEIGSRPAGYTTEVNLAAEEWIGAVASKLIRGVVLAIDYGFARAEYYAPERNTGTLRGYAAHRPEPDPLARPGEIDLTAHVDFTAVSSAGARAGLRVHGFCDQHHFFVGLGRTHFPDGTIPDPQEMRAFKTLMHPGLLGLSFQVLALEKQLASPAPLMGFAFAAAPALQ